MSIFSINRLPSILKVPKYSPLPSPAQFRHESAELPVLRTPAKPTYFDFNTTSLGDLETCTAFTSGIDNQHRSSTSTVAGSTVSIEGRGISRNFSLITDLGTSCEIDKQKNPGSPNVKRFDELVKDQENNGPGHELQVNEEDTSIILEPEYQHLCPSFDLKGAHAPFYAFSGGNRIATHKSDNRFSALFADKPLPTSGRYRFSVYITECSNINPKLYVGIVSKEQRDKPLSYKSGCYFMNTFSPESYLNGLKILSQDAFARQGQILSVMVDMDERSISFELDDIEVLRGKLAFPKNKVPEFYPCISLGEIEGAIEFI